MLNAGYMKRNAVIALGVCCVCLLHGQYGRAQAKTKEKLSGIFSIGDNRKVCFSPGNLQYNAAEGTHRCADGTTKQGTWRFAERQWDIVGMGYGQTDENRHNYIGGTVMNSDNRQADSSYDGWIDLFGWGTSGWNSGAKAYEPWSLSSEDADYYPGSSPSNNLTGEYVYADWGIYNQIGDDAPGTWRTLTKHEWDYLFQKRPNAKSKWGTAKVNGMTGLVVLPDEWALPEGCGFTAGLTDAEEWYDWSEVAPSNLYTLAQWRMMEAAGAVFLPCAGYRYGITVYRAGSYGNYWSSTSGSRTPYTLRFYSNIIYPSGTIGYNYGASVRLVSEHIQHSQTRYETVYDTICYQPVYTYWGQEYTLAPGENVADGYANYYFEYEDQSEDVVYQLYLAVALPVPETILPDKYLCEGDAYQWLDGGYYTTNQTLTYTLQSRKTGCDSIVTLRLLAAPTYHVQFADTVLQGATYYWQDKYLSEEGVYEEHLTTADYGCDSVLSLHLHTNKVEISEVTIADQCADDGSLNIAWQGEGVTDAVRVTVSRLQPQAQTYETVRIAVDENTRTATIPFAGRAGYYQAQTDFLYKGQTAHTRTVPFTRLYPSSVLEQAWNDVIAVLTHDYNGGYDFIAFEWLKDGQPIAGEKRPYLYEPLVMGAEYSALLTEEDGTRLECCPITVTPHTDDVRVYPVIANPSRQVNCHVSEPSEMTIYDAAGRLVLTQSLVTGDNIFSGPGVQGTYLVRVCMTQNGRIRTLKLVVQ